MSKPSDVLGRVVQRIREVADPLQIILFGSAARGEIKPDSDLDVLVVMPNGSHRLEATMMLYRNVRGIGVPVDILVTTPEVLERHRNNAGLIYKTILKEGKSLYVADAA